MTDPISIHNVPAQLDLTGRPKWEQQKRNAKRQDAKSTGEEKSIESESSSDSDSTAMPAPPPDGTIGTQVDFEA